MSSVHFQIGNCSPPQQSRLIEFVLENVIEFSTNKYASNVVESCVCLATAAQQQHVMHTICELDAIRLHRFCIDASANYVVQKLMETASDEHLNTLYIKLSPYFNLMERYVCGRKIVDKIKLIPTARINDIALALHHIWIGSN